MIVAEVGEVDVVWADGQLGLIPESARIRRAFRKPARARRSATAADGSIEEQRVKVPPGTDEHARAVLQGLGAKILLDTAE